MRAGRGAEGLAWTVAAGAAAVAFTQTLRRTPTPLAAMGQALTPVLALAAVPAAVVGIARRRVGLAALAGGSAIALGSLVHTVRTVRRRSPAAVAPGGAVLTIAHVNMLFTNHNHATDACAAVMATGADVIALSEVTPGHLRELERQGAGRYPVRISDARQDSHGFVLWSEFPLDNIVQRPLVRRPGAVADVETPAGPLRVVLAHPDPPTKWRWMAPWHESLQAISELGASPGPPTVIVADLNATRWHPPFRALLNGGWRDAHEAVGRGLSTSWPTLGPIPAFVRLDHALIDDRLDVVDIVDFSVPGSDHRGFVVTVAAR